MNEERKRSLEIIFGLRKALRAERERGRWLWENCKIVFYPSDGAYPIEHNPHAGKDSKQLIGAEMQKLLSRKDSDG